MSNNPPPTNRVILSVQVSCLHRVRDSFLRVMTQDHVNEIHEKVDTGTDDNVIGVVYQDLKEKGFEYVP